MQDHIRLVVTVGTGGSYGNCTGFVADAPSTANDTLATFASEYTNYATGAFPWTATGSGAPDSRTYQMTWSFDTTALTQAEIDALQGKSVALNFNWEIQD